MRKKNKNDIKKLTLALVMMVKNEKHRISVTLNSILDNGNPLVDCIVIYDTGSTDNTIDIITQFCNKCKIPLHLKKGEFVDFSTSRNVSLDFADDKADWNILLDCNDEFRNGKFLRNYTQNFSLIPNENGKVITAFHVKQKWKSNPSVDEYYNMRLFLTKYNWRYKCVVHEYLDSDHPNIIKKNVQVPEFYIYQDRTKDDDKSSKRFNRDKVLLYNDYLKNQTNSRTLFYLAQTYSCLSQKDKAYEFSLRRLKLDDFLEEKYHSYYRCGEYSLLMNHDWEESFSWYLQAFQFSVSISKFYRIEPLIRIAQYYKDKNWKFGYFFLKIACSLEYPSDCVLFVDRDFYDYERWHLMGVYVYYVGNINPVFGLNAAKIAYEKKKLDVDLGNMNAYTKLIKSKEVIEHKPTELDKKDSEFGDTYDTIKKKADNYYEKIKPRVEDMNHKLTQIKENAIKITTKIDKINAYINKNKNDEPSVKLYKNKLIVCKNEYSNLEKDTYSIQRENIDLCSLFLPCLIWYLKLFERSMREFDVPKIHPLIILSEFYNRRSWLLSYIFTKEACDLKPPENYNKDTVLKHQYDYLRFHLLSISAHNVNKNEIGYEACKRAITANKNSDMDRKNLAIFKKILKTND